MSLETDLIAVLVAQCPRSFPTTAPFGTPLPYVTWQHIGGESLRSLDNKAADRRNAYIQVNAWASSSKDAFDLLRTIEDALCAALPQLQASPQGEPSDSYDDGNGDDLRGATQSFSIWGSRY